MWTLLVSRGTSEDAFFFVHEHRHQCMTLPLLVAGGEWPGDEMLLFQSEHTAGFREPITLSTRPINGPMKSKGRVAVGSAWAVVFKLSGLEPNGAFRCEVERKLLCTFVWDALLQRGWL